MDHILCDVRIWHLRFNKYCRPRCVPAGFWDMWGWWFAGPEAHCEQPPPSGLLCSAGTLQPVHDSAPEFWDHSSAPKQASELRSRKYLLPFSLCKGVLSAPQPTIPPFSMAEAVKHQFSLLSPSQGQQNSVLLLGCGALRWPLVNIIHVSGCLPFLLSSHKTLWVKVDSCPATT